MLEGVQRAKLRRVHPRLQGMAHQMLMDSALSPNEPPNWAGSVPGRLYAAARLVLGLVPCVGPGQSVCLTSSHHSALLQPESRESICGEFE